MKIQYQMTSTKTHKTSFSFEVKNLFNGRRKSPNSRLKIEKSRFICDYARILKICLIFLYFSLGFASGQDTIFMKNGVIIPSIIQNKTLAEIYYKKLPQPGSQSIYTVFIYEVSSIHYQNGKIEYFNINTIETSGKKSQDMLAPSADQFFKFGLGINENRFNRIEDDNLLNFWRFINANQNLQLSGNPRYMSFEFTFSSPMGGTKRNWFGGKLQLIGTPENSIYASNNTGLYLNEIKLRNLYYNIIMFYGHSINRKKNLIAIFEPGINLGTMVGTIKYGGEESKVSEISGISSHFALGLDWIVSKRFTFNIRGGRKFMKTTDTSFYGDPLKKEILFVNWGGYYIGAGLSISFYKKMNFVGK